MPPLPPSTLSQFKLMPFTRVAVGRRRWRQFSPVGRQFNANSGGHFWANLRCTWRWRGHRDLTRTRVYVTCSMKKWWCNIPVCCCCLHKSIDNMAVFFLPIFFPLYLLLLPFFFLCYFMDVQLAVAFLLFVILACRRTIYYWRSSASFIHLHSTFSTDSVSNHWDCINLDGLFFTSNRIELQHEFELH